MKSQAPDAQAPDTSRPHRGRRPAGSGTREAILSAARDEFGERGYQKATIRSIARSAGVDPRLIVHYFGSKQRLFAASVELPKAAEERFTGTFEHLPGTSEPGRVLAEAVVQLIEDPDMQPVMVGLIRAASTEPEAADMIREALIQSRLQPMAASLGGDDSELRASFIASQVVGLLVARHITRVEPLASATAPQLVAALAPVFEHYLTGDWTQETARG